MSHETLLWVRMILNLVAIVISSIAIIVSVRAKRQAEATLRQIRGTDSKGSQS